MNLTFSLFAFLDVGTPEIVLILFVALLLFGGKKLPELAKGLGKAVREFKEATSGVEAHIKRAMDEPRAEEKAVVVSQIDRSAAFQPESKAATAAEKTPSIPSGPIP